MRLGDLNVSTQDLCIYIEQIINFVEITQILERDCYNL